MNRYVNISLKFALGIGGAMSYIFKIYFTLMNYADVGHGQWHVRCNSLLYSQSICSFMQSKFNDL